MQLKINHIVRETTQLIASVLFMFMCNSTASAINLTEPEQLNIGAKHVQVLDDWDVALEVWRSRSTEGLRLTDIERYDENGRVSYSVTWMEGDDQDYLLQARTWSEFEAKTRELAGRGLRLVDVEIFLEHGETRYLGVWRSGVGNFALWTCPTWDALTEKWHELSNRGLQLIDIEVYHGLGATQYFGLFRADRNEDDLWNDEDWKDIPP